MRKASSGSTICWKLAIIASLLLAASAVRAGAPEDAYFAARDAAIARYAAVEATGASDSETVKQNDSEIDKLGQQLQRLVGPVAVKGFPGAGKASLEALGKHDEGYGWLDGLSFATPDSKSALVVTTEPLLTHWLKEHENWYGSKDERMPQDVHAALASEIFYNQAMSTDAAVSRYVELPVTKPAGATFAYAMLIGRSQIDDPRIPDEIIISAISGGRIYLMRAPTPVALHPLPACQALWDRRAGNAEQQRAKANAAFHRCYAQKARSEPFYPVLAKEAQVRFSQILSP
jgi:hypothetical protein